MLIYDDSVWSDTWTCFNEAAAILARVLPNRAWDVLVLGCGDGKHTIPFLLDGHRVTAVDDDPTVVEGGTTSFAGHTVVIRPLLENCRRAGAPAGALELVQTDYMRFDSPQKFDVVLTSCSWQFRRNWQYPIAAMLEKVRSFVGSGGVLIADYMQPHGERYLAVEHYLTPAALARHFPAADWRFHLHRDDGIVRERHINGEAWHEHRYASLVVQRVRWPSS